MAAAIARARQEGAVLLVAKLDRLACNVAFLATLMESRVRFQAVDLPAADELTFHIMAAVAQKEASAISTRTRDALAAKKVRGAQLGTPANLSQTAREKSWVAMTQNAQANLNNRQAAQLATLLRLQGQRYGLLWTNSTNRTIARGTHGCTTVTAQAIGAGLVKTDSKVR